MQQVLFTAARDAVSLTVTDLSTRLELKLPGALVLEEGQLAVPAGFMAQLAKTLPTESLQLRSQGGHAAGGGRPLRHPGQVRLPGR